MKFKNLNFFLFHSVFSFHNDQVSKHLWIAFYWNIIDSQYPISFRRIIVIQYFYTLWNDPHNKSRYHLSLYKVIIILLAIFSMLYITFLWITYFMNTVISDNEVCWEHLEVNFILIKPGRNKSNICNIKLNLFPN